MNLNHLDLQVSDVQRSVLLFDALFGFRLQTSRTSPAVAILTNDASFSLVLQRKKSADEAWPEGFHCGFLVADADFVRCFRETAVAHDGIHVSEVIENGRGTLVYCRDWDGLVIEVSCPRLRPDEA